MNRLLLDYLPLAVFIGVAGFIGLALMVLLVSVRRGHGLRALLRCVNTGA